MLAELRTPAPALAGSQGKPADVLNPADLYLVWKGEGSVVEDDTSRYRPGDLGFVDQIAVR